MAEFDEPTSLLEAFDLSVGRFRKQLKLSVECEKGADELHIRRILRARRYRSQIFPEELFADPAWDMLLELYLADLQNAVCTVTSLCNASDVPATTALRWIKNLEHAGLVQRSSDQQDKRRKFLKLKNSAKQKLLKYFSDLEKNTLGI